MVELVIRNARMVLETGVVRGGLAVQNGRICAIATDEHLPSGDTEIDAESKILLPGLIDAHAHIHDPKMLEHEDFTTGSSAAAAGGITTFIDMPLTNQVDSIALADEKINAGNAKSLVDFSFSGGMMNSENVKNIHGLSEKGILAFKAFTCEPYQTSNGVITQCLSTLSELGGHLTVHSEDQGVLDEFKRGFDEDWDAPVAHSLSRPNLADQLAIKQMIAIAENTGGHLHIAHVTTSEGLKEIERGKLHGVMVTTEVCPHHLMFERDEMNRLGTKSKMNPPLRTGRDRSALWSGLLRGTIDLVVSDHAPCPIEKKDAGSEDIPKSFAQSNHPGELYDTLVIAPAQVKTLRVLDCQEPLTKGLHGPGDGCTKGDGIHAVLVCQVVAIEDRLQVIIPTPGTHRGLRFKLRRAALKGIWPVSHCSVSPTAL